MLGLSWKFLFFLLLAATTFICVAMVIWQIKTRRLRKIIEKRTEELRYSLLRLEASETELKNSLEFRQRVIKILVHDLKSPLAFINIIAKNVLEMHATLEEDERDHLLEELYNATFKITGFVTDMLCWLNLNQQYFKSNIKIISLNHFIRTHCNLYIDIAHKRNLKFEFRSDDSFTVETDESLIQIVIRNLIDNAIKNTHSGSIVIDGYVKDAIQYIAIQDTGVGMPADKAIELEKGIIARKSSESTQIGFRIIYDLVKKMGASIKVNSNESGTTILIRIPK